MESRCQEKRNSALSCSAYIPKISNDCFSKNARTPKDMVQIIGNYLKSTEIFSVSWWWHPFLLQEPETRGHFLSFTLIGRPDMVNIIKITESFKELNWLFFHKTIKNNNSKFQFVCSIMILGIDMFCPVLPLRLRFFWSQSCHLGSNF